MFFFFFVLVFLVVSASEPPSFLSHHLVFRDFGMNAFSHEQANVLFKSYPLTMLLQNSSEKSHGTNRILLAHHLIKYHQLRFRHSPQNEPIPTLLFADVAFAYSLKEQPLASTYPRCLRNVLENAVIFLHRLVRPAQPMGWLPVKPKSPDNFSVCVVDCNPLTKEGTFSTFIGFVKYRYVQNTLSPQELQETPPECAFLLPYLALWKILYDLGMGRMIETDNMYVLLIRLVSVITEDGNGVRNPLVIMDVITWLRKLPESLLPMREPIVALLMHISTLHNRKYLFKT